MPISGTFLADFKSFYDACQKAEVSLKSFETGGAKVETALNRMSNSLSGTKLIQDATLMVEAVERIGGVSKLTEKELARVGATAAEAAAKMRAMGVDVPPGMQKIADAAGGAEQKTSVFAGSFARLTASFAAANVIDRVVGSLINWGAEAFTAAAQINNLAAKTGLTTDTIQEMTFAAEQTGSSIQAFSSAAFTLGVRLAGGSGSVRKAVEDLGLSFSAVRAMSPDEQFKVITTALGTMATEQERNRLGMLLFKGTFQDVAVAVGEGYTQLAGRAVKMSKETTDAAAQFDNAWAGTKATIKAVIAESLAFSAAPFIAAAQAMGLMSVAVVKVEKEVKAAADGTGAWVTRMAVAKAEVGDLTTAEWAQIEAATRLGATQEELMDSFSLGADALRIVTERLTANKKAQQDAATETKKYTDALVEIAASGATWQDTLAKINGQTVDAVRAYNDAGVSMAALAIRYKLTATEIKAITLFMAEQVDQQKLHDAAVQQSSQLWNEYDKLRVEQGGTATDSQIADIARWAADLTAKMVKAKTDTQAFYDALAATSAAKTASVLVDWTAIGTNSRAALQQAADKAQATYLYMAGRTGEFSTEVIAQFERTAVAAQQKADAWGTAFGGAVDKITAKVQQAAPTWSQAMALADKGEGTMSFTTQGSARKASKETVMNAARAGRYFGPVDQFGDPDYKALGLRDGTNGYQNFGSGTPAILHGWEKVTPLGRESGGGGASSIVVNISTMMGNPAEIARVVKAALVDAARSTGQRLPTGA